METSAVVQFVAQLTEDTKAEPPVIPFTPEEYAGGLAKLRQAMAEDGIRTLLLSSPEAMCWLHGLSLRWYKSQSPRDWRPLTCTAVNVDSDDFIQFEGTEHEEMLRRTSIARDIRLLPRYQRGDMLGFIVGELAAVGWLDGTVGVEKYAHLPNVAVAAQLAAATEAKGATVVDGTDAARRVRRTKSPAEIAYVEKAAERPRRPGGLCGARDGCGPRLYRSRPSRCAGPASRPLARPWRLPTRGTAAGDPG